MKGIYLIAIATIFLVTWNVIIAEEQEFDKISTKCPAVDTTIHLPHESDCTKFYICQHGKKILQECPYMNEKGDRLHFNPRLQVCDWPWTVGCKHRNFDEDETEAINKEFIVNEEYYEPFIMDEIPTKCPAKDPKNTTIHLAHESDCTKFYMCQQGEKILRECPYRNEKGDRLHFNPRLQVCDWPWRAGCKHRHFDEDETEAINKEFILNKEYYEPSVMDEIPTKCPAKDPKNTTIHLAHESDCTKFYMCQQGEKILRECPYRNEKGDRLHFNPRLQVCDWPWRAGCKHRHFDEDETEAINKEFILNEEYYKPSVMDEIPTKCPAKDPKNTTIHLAHESDCTKFYMCQQGKKILRECPYMNEKGDRLHFNPRLQVCDWPWKAGCKPGDSDGDECSWDNNGRLLPHECNCDVFYECVKGNKILRECPDDFYFSKKYQGCVKVMDSDCKVKPPVKCTKKGELIPHECDCTKYYKCREDDQVLRKCKNDLHFSPKRRKCEDPDIAGCDRDESRPGPGDCPKPIPEYPWHHECDCRLFYRCENGKKRLYECSWGYYFDAKKDKCAPQEHVTDCKNRWDD